MVVMGRGLGGVRHGLGKGWGGGLEVQGGAECLVTAVSHTATDLVEEAHLMLWKRIKA